MSDNNDKQPEGGPSPWMKSLLIWVGILAALALFVSFFNGSSTQQAANAVPYSTFLDRVESGEV